MLPSWGLSVTEMMCRYVRATGLKATGPHRREDSDVMKLLQPCSLCGGSGVVDSGRGETWKECSECSGSGYLLTGTKDEFEREIGRLLSRFPNARDGVLASFSIRNETI